MSRVTKASPLELLIGKVARPLGILLAGDEESQVDIEQARTQAIDNMEKGALYDKVRFDKTKAKITPFSVGDFVFLQNEERNQTKLDPKFRGPFKVTEVFDGNRYVLKALNCNRTYKYAHDRLKPMPANEVVDEDDTSILGSVDQD